MLFNVFIVELFVLLVLFKVSHRGGYKTELFRACAKVRVRGRVAMSYGVRSDHDQTGCLGKKKSCTESKSGNCSKYFHFELRSAISLKRHAMRLLQKSSTRRSLSRLRLDVYC